MLNLYCLEILKEKKGQPSPENSDHLISKAGLS